MDENTDNIVISIAEKKLGLKLIPDNIDRSHRVGRKNEKCRPIIVKFISYRYRKMVITARRKLKGTGLSIQEDLTRKRIDLLHKTKDHERVSKAWSVDGRVFASIQVKGREVIKSIRSLSDLDNF